MVKELEIKIERELLNPQCNLECNLLLYLQVAKNLEKKPTKRTM